MQTELRHRIGHDRLEILGDLGYFQSTWQQSCSCQRPHTPYAFDTLAAFCIWRIYRDLQRIHQQQERVVSISDDLQGISWRCIWRCRLA